jgi:hypothetical protein
MKHGIATPNFNKKWDTLRLAAVAGFRFNTDL